MSDVNGFIDALGRDVTNTIVPRIETFADGFRDKTLTDYGPRVSAFANQFVKEILDEQSATFRAFVTTVLQDLFQRYRPELVGEVHATVVKDGVQLTGQQIRSICSAETPERQCHHWRFRCPSRSRYLNWP